MYEVYWRAEGGDWSSIGTSKETSYIVDQGVSQDITYFFKVRANNECASSGPFSDQLSTKKVPNHQGQVKVIQTQSEACGVRIFWFTEGNQNRRFLVYLKRKSDTDFMQLQDICD